MKHLLLLFLCILSFKCSAQNSCHGIEAIFDIDSNIYHCSPYGVQCWMQENMRASRTQDGKSISVFNPSINDSITLWASTINYSGSTMEKFLEYGYLYTWIAALKVCPKGWHLPSQKEWEILFQYVSADSTNWCGENPQNISKALASSVLWMVFDETEYGDCTPAINPSSNNSSGFNAKPAGLVFYDYTNRQIIGTGGFDAHFWTSTPIEMRSQVIGIGGEEVSISPLPRQWGLSVRCIMD